MIKDRDKTAIAVGDRRISFHQLLMQVTHFSQITPKDKGAKTLLISENRIGWIYAFFSIWNNRGVAIPVDSSSTTAELAYIINDCKPDAIWVSEGKHQTVSDAVKMTDVTPDILLITKEMEESDEVYDTADIKYDNNDLALIMYTSGTTGSPKGVMLSFLNIMSNVKAVSEEVQIFKEDRCVMILLPLHHILPLVGSVLAPLITGGGVALSPSLTGADIMATMQNNHVAIIIGVPRLYATLFKGIYAKIDAHFLTRFLFKFAKALGSRGFSRFIFKSVRDKMGGKITYLVSGGAALEKTIGEGFKTLGLDVLEGYGMTEAAPMISFTRPDEIYPGVSGKPMPSVTVEIRDGEVCAKGQNIMLGYYNRPKETAEVIREGWLYTGDLGYLNDKGQLVLTGRKKEIIVLSNGKNVNPVEIEQHLEHYAAYIKECGIIPLKDQLHAIIVPADDVSSVLSDEELIQKIKWEVIEPYNRSVSSYKKVMNFSIYKGNLPRTRLEKIQRFKLPELLSQSSTGSTKETVAEPDSPVYQILRDFIGEEKNCMVHPTDHIEMDLGLDSLDKVGLQVFIQSSFGMEMNNELMLSFANVAEMAQYVTEQKTRMEVEKIDWKRILKEKVSLQLPKSWFTGRLMIKIAKPFLSIYFGLKAKGVENIPSGPVILAPNHQSYLDGLFVISFLKWNSIKNTYFYAKEQHVKHPLIKAIASKHNIIVMKMSDLKDSIQKLSVVLKKQKSIIIFPEGTRTKTGSLGEFKKTFAILSKELNVPIVPVSISGAFKSMPRGRLFPRPSKKIEIDFLTPVYPENYSYEEISLKVYSSIRRHQLNKSLIIFA